MQRQKRGARKRTGCTKCKEQHIPCSEELPRCRRCDRLDLECLRGLKLVFREDAIQRGISFGREGVWSKKPRPTVCNRTTEVNFHGIPLSQYYDRWIFLNLNEEDFQEPERVSRKRAQAQSIDRSPDLITDSSISRSIYHPFYAFQETERYLLDYFVQDMGPSCSLSGVYNPYISLMVPLCFESTTLQPALLAVAANQLCLLGNRQFTEQACHYKHMALQGIRQDLSTGLYDAGTIASILMLCFHEISDACSLSWILHLRAGLQMLDDSSTPHSSSDLWKFFRMYFVAHDIMSRITSHSGSWPMEEVSQLWHESEDLEEFDMLMGCSRGLLTTINQVSVHASAKEKILKSRSLNPSEFQKYAKISMEIGTALLSLKQKLPARCSGRKNLERIAQIKHLAALLYLTERLGHFEPECDNPTADCSAPPKTPPLEADDFGRSRPTALEKSSKARQPQPDGRNCGERASLCHKLPAAESDIGGQDGIGVLATCRNHLVSGMIELISTLPDIPTLLWPLFVLGNANLQNEEQRRFVLDRLDSIRKTQNLGSVRRTFVAVKHAFKTKSLLSTSGTVWGHQTYGYISLA